MQTWPLPPHQLPSCGSVVQIRGRELVFLCWGWGGAVEASLFKPQESIHCRAWQLYSQLLPSNTPLPSALFHKRSIRVEDPTQVQGRPGQGKGKERSWANLSVFTPTVFFFSNGRPKNFSGNPEFFGIKLEKVWWKCCFSIRLKFLK